LRLSEIAAQNGIDSFEFDDFLFVGKSLSQDPARLVLVGGQAIETWGNFFQVSPPTGDQAPLTEDTDFLGNRDDAKWLCKLLGKGETELILAKDFDPSPNSAIAYLQRPDGRILLIDFLHAIVGVTNEDIGKTAVRITVAGCELKVLHPLLCLKSRLANLEKLSTKRNTNGIMQAQWAINIVHAYLLNLLDRKDVAQRDLIRQFTDVTELAEYGSGPYCFRNFGLDPLKAITQDMVERVGSRFVNEDWPRRIARIKEKRNKHGRLLMRLDMSNLKPEHSIPVVRIPLLSGITSDKA
jgi:hypothetical protein